MQLFWSGDHSSWMSLRTVPQGVWEGPTRPVIQNEGTEDGLSRRKINLYDCRSSKFDLRQFVPFEWNPISAPDAVPTSCCLCLNVLPAIGPILHKIPIMGEQPTLPLQQELFCFFYHLSAARQAAKCIAMYGCHIYKCMIHFPRSLVVTPTSTQLSRGWGQLLHERWGTNFSGIQQHDVLDAHVCQWLICPSPCCVPLTQVLVHYDSPKHTAERAVRLCEPSLIWVGGLIASNNNEVQRTGHYCEQILPIKRCISAEAEVRCLIGSFHHGLKGLIGWHSERWMGQLSRWRKCAFMYVC